VFNGQKNITEKSIDKFAKLLSFNKRQTKYFTFLVLFGRAKSDAEVKHYFEELLSFTELNSQRIEADSYEFYKKWYYTAVREILAYYPFSGDYEELAKMVVPPIKTTEVKKAISLLERLGFIKKNKTGRYELTSRFITTGDEWRSIAIKAFQEDTLQLAIDALTNIPKEDRDISTVTVTLSKKSFEKLREKLKDFRQEVLKIAHQEEEANGAYHVNFQLIPIGKHWPEETQ
jgi:uncharacterized protein (TIGR02147 family)